jgi:hypothetical protein
MKDFSELLKGIASILWPIIVAFIIIAYKYELKKLFETVIRNLRSGGSLKLGLLELKGVIIKDQASTTAGEDVFVNKNIERRPASSDDFELRRRIRYESRFIRLVHIVAYNSTEKFPFDVSVYIKAEHIFPHYDMDKEAKPARLNDIKYVEYYFGHYFGESEFGDWFIIRDPKDGFAVKYSTMDEVTCIARIHFHSGEVVELLRYLDLEMGELLKKMSTGALEAE